jgi:hypothetical protein
MPTSCKVSVFILLGKSRLIMIAKDAKHVARQWVIMDASKAPGFDGAFYAGSTNWLPDDAVFPSTSDVDVWVVLADPDLLAKPGKFIYRDVILDVSYLPSDQLRSPHQILGDYHMAGSFRTPSTISDPSGRLTKLQAVVSRDFAKRQWVYKRREHAKNRVLRNLQSLNESEPFHDQVTAWLFATGVTTHVLLVAGLRNPTVRRRYVAARELLVDYGHLDFYETLLEVWGVPRWVGSVSNIISPRSPICSMQPRQSSKRLSFSPRTSAISPDRSLSTEVGTWSSGATIERAYSGWLPRIPGVRRCFTMMHQRRFRIGLVPATGNCSVILA